MSHLKLDPSLVRNYFPSLKSDWAFFDNAGGAQVPVFVLDRIRKYLIESNVQQGASYTPSQEAGHRTTQAITAMQDLVHAKNATEMVIGSSTTQLLLNLSISLGKLLQAGDEIIVTNCDHEANIGPWVNLRLLGIIIKFWKINPDSYQLDLHDLEGLLTKKTRLVAVTHASNILGQINPIKEIAALVHARGAWLCVDGVGYAAHRKIDVQDLDVDFYVFSFYKVFGPHLAMLYVKQPVLDLLPGINHYFISEKSSAYKLQPGNFNFELTYGLLGITDYFEHVLDDHFRQEPFVSDITVRALQNSDSALQNINTRLSFFFDLVATYEEILSRIFLDFLCHTPGIQVIGITDGNKALRLPIFSFTVQHIKSPDLVRRVDAYKIGIRFGDFYARRLLEDLSINPTDGVIRVSMAHYNTESEVRLLIDSLQDILL